MSTERVFFWRSALEIMFRAFSERFFEKRRRAPICSRDLRHRYASRDLLSYAMCCGTILMKMNSKRLAIALAADFDDPAARRRSVWVHIVGKNITGSSKSCT